MYARNARPTHQNINFELKKMMLDKNANKKKRETLVKWAHFYLDFSKKIKYFALCSLDWGIQIWSRIWNRT